MPGSDSGGCSLFEIPCCGPRDKRWSGESVTQPQGESFKEKDENFMVGLGLKFSKGGKPSAFPSGIVFDGFVPLGKSLLRSCRNIGMNIW